MSRPTQAFSEMLPYFLRDLQYVPQEPEQLKRALRDMLQGWLELIHARDDATADYRHQTLALEIAAMNALADGLTAYEVVVLIVASPFVGPDDARVVPMPLTDEQIDAGQTVLEAWAVEDDA